MPGAVRPARHEPLADLDWSAARARDRERFELRAGRIVARP
jgi:hypothetical protein